MRLFTETEANEALEIVRPLVARLVEAHGALADAVSALEAVESAVAGNGGRLRPDRLRALHEAHARAATRLAGLVTELDDLGVQVKDAGTGLVDFPARHPADGHTVLLCWRLGEDAVAHWHGADEGFAGRKPLPF